ncbi:general transcription repressor [Fusarium falciforme]|nr:general transcription repressor [Fusarium falciforme]
MHMEDMALFILPNTQEDQDLGGTNDSVQVEKLSHSRSQISSLGFSAPGDYGQNPADFSKLLTSEEAGYSSKLTHWKVTHDPEVASLKALVQQPGDQDEKVRHAAVKALGSQPALPYEISEAMGARLECRDRNGLTVLSWAAKNGHEVTFERLIEKGADFESKDWNNDGEPPLYCAAWGGNEAIVRMLLELGADFESKTEDGKSPLHYAAWNGNEAIVRMLLEIGADAQMKDNRGDTALSLATGNGDEAIIQLLQQHADSPASRQSSETYHSVPYNAGDVTAGISSAEINLNSVPTLYKKVGQDWHAVFNPKLQRDLDVDLVHVLGHSFPVTSVRFSHDGMHIATSSHRTARIFDIQTGEQVRVLDHNTPNTDQSIYISSVSFSPDDHYLATGGDNGMVCVSQFPACIQLQLN